MTTTISSTAATAASQITAAAIDSFARCEDPRLREIMRSLVRHLHAFADDVHLTEAEWVTAIGILTASGHITDDKRQEFILWSDTLGLSMLVDALAHPGASASGATQSTVLGPFWTPDAPMRSPAPCSTSGRTATTACTPSRTPKPPKTIYADAS
jgi:hydroxyquinol 1,2-dioxygenase